MNIVVVNESDEFIKLVPDELLKPSHIYRCAGLWLTNSRQEILLAQRKLTKKNDPGKWGPAVSGTIEQGETYESNIYKEAAEEIGLTGQKFSIGPKVFNNYGKYRFFVQWFSCQVDWPIEKFKIQADEVEQIAWIAKAGLINDLTKNPGSYIAGATQVWSQFLA